MQTVLPLSISIFQQSVLLWMTSSVYLSQGMKIVKEIIDIYVCDYLGCHACVRIMYIEKPKKYSHTLLISANTGSWNAVHFVHVFVLASQKFYFMFSACFDDLRLFFEDMNFNNKLEKKIVHQGSSGWLLFLLGVPCKMAYSTVVEYQIYQWNIKV